MRIKPTCPSLLSFFVILLGYSQNLRRPVSSAYTGFGAYSINNADVFSFSANQASLAQLKSAGAGIFGERRFWLNELNNYAAAIALPTKSGSFGFKAGYNGFSGYNESQVGLAYARKLGGKIDIGVQFNYNGVRIAGYGNANAVSFELGTVLHLTDKLHAGVHINNPVGGKFGKDQQEKLSSVYTVGFGYEASEKFFVSTEIIKEENQLVNINAGLQYKFHSRVLARVGMLTATSTAWMGIGLSWKSIRVDVTAAYHPQLGVSPGIMLLFSANNKKNE